MYRQSEFKIKFNPELGKFTKQHIWGEKTPIYGEGISDIFKLWGKKLFGKTMKKAAKKGIEKAVTSAATKTGEHVGKKAGDKIVKMLSKEKVKPTNKKVTFSLNTANIPNNPKVNTLIKNPNNRNNINKRVNAILSGGSIHK